MIKKVNKGKLNPQIDYVEECKGKKNKMEWINWCINKKLPFAYMDVIWTFCHIDRTNTITDKDELHDKMLQCLKDFTWEDKANQSLVIVGPAGCGKTNWVKIRATKPSLFITHLDALRNFDPTYHKSIIFDDMDFNRLPRPTQIYLLDRENQRDIHIRYKVVHLPAGVEKYFTANMDPFPRGDPALERRWKWVNVDTTFMDLMNKK